MSVRRYFFYNILLLSFLYLDYRAVKDGRKRLINLHNRLLRVCPADSWHQPDSVHYQTKKSVTKQSSKFILNKEAEIHKLNDDCLVQIFQFLPIVDRLRIEQGKLFPISKSVINYIF